jgi:hypothetical protein
VRKRDLLGTDSADRTCHSVGMIRSKKDRLELERQIILDVRREMDKPRLAESVRAAEEIKSERFSQRTAAPAKKL